MNVTNSMTEILIGLLRLTDNVGNQSGKEKRGDKTEGKAGKLAGLKS